MMAVEMDKLMIAMASTIEAALGLPPNPPPPPGMHPHMAEIINLLMA